MSLKSIVAKFVVCALALTGALQHVAFATDVVRVQFVQRPPYMLQVENGKVEGLLPPRVEQIFDGAKVPIEWELTSVNRQWDALLNPNVMTCAIGWFKNPEREKVAKFTKPIYQDQPQVLLARKQFEIDANEKLEEVLATQNLRVLVKNKYSYGSKIDEMLKSFGTKTVVSDAENRQMVKILIANRADFMFMTKEEAQYLLDNNDPYHELQVLIPSNMPEGEKRYIACNRLVPDELIERLNRANNFDR